MANPNDGSSKGIIDKDKRYVCTCGSSPEFKDCAKCLAKKTDKYDCFNCETPSKATLICRGCLNHFVCSKQCHEYDMRKVHNHSLTCNKSLPVWCKHGRPILLQNLRTCDCRMCEHGMWSEDCYKCISNEHMARASEAGKRGGKRSRK